MTEPTSQADSVFRATVGRLARCVFHRKNGKPMTEKYEAVRRRELLCEIEQLKGSMNMLGEKFRTFAANNPGVKHDPRVLLLKSMGLPDPHPELTALEEEREGLLKRWHIVHTEYATL